MVVIHSADFIDQGARTSRKDSGRQVIPALYDMEHLADSKIVREDYS